MLITTHNLVGIREESKRICTLYLSTVEFGVYKVVRQGNCNLQFVKKYRDVSTDSTREVRELIYNTRWIASGMEREDLQLVSFARIAE